MDLRANLTESVTLQPLESHNQNRAFIGCLLVTEAQVHEADLAAKTDSINSPGTIDADYRVK
jgi:dUTPase